MRIIAGAGARDAGRGGVPHGGYLPAGRAAAARGGAVSVRSGETVRLRFTAANPSAVSVVLEFREDCRVSLAVLDATERPVDAGDADSGCLQTGAGRVTVPSGGTWQAAATADGTPLAPGTYALGAVLGEHESVFRGRRDYKLSHAADTVQIRVLSSGAP